MTAPTPEEVAKLVSRLRDVEVLFGRNVAAGRHAGDAADALEAVQAAREAAEEYAAALKRDLDEATFEIERLNTALVAALAEREMCVNIARTTALALDGPDNGTAEDGANAVADALLAYPAPDGADALAAALRKARVEVWAKAVSIADGQVHDMLPVSDRQWNAACRSIARDLRAAAEAEERGDA